MTEREIMGFLNEYLPELQAARQSQNGLCGLGNNLRLKYRDGFGTKFSFYSSVTLQEGRDSRRFLGPWTRNKMREIFADCMDVGLAEVISERRGRGGEREEATMATVKLAATDDINARTLLEQALTLLKQLRSKDTTEIMGTNSMNMCMSGSIREISPKMQKTLTMMQTRNKVEIRCSLISRKSLETG